MRKILVIGDPHFMSHNAFETNQLFDEIKKMIDDSTVDYIVVLGDVLNNFEKMDLLTFNRCTDFLEMCMKGCKHLFILVGNHDRRNQTEFLVKENSLCAFRNWEHTTLVETVKDFIDDEIKILLVPYVYPGRFFEAIESETKNIYDYDVVFSHQEFYGVKLDSGPISEIGDKYPDDAPMCFNGHIHKYGEVYSNLLNVGTPYNKDFGDLGNKGVVVITFESGNLSYERILLNVRKKKKLEILEEELSSLEISDNVFYKIIVKGNPEIISLSTEYKRISKLPNVTSSIQDNRATIVPEEINPIIKKQSFTEYVNEQLVSRKKLQSLFREIGRK